MNMHSTISGVWTSPSFRSQEFVLERSSCWPLMSVRPMGRESRVVSLGVKGRRDIAADRETFRVEVLLSARAREEETSKPLLSLSMVLKPFP